MAWSNPKPNYCDMTEKEKTFRHATGKLYLQLCSESGSNPRVRRQPLSEVPTELHTNGIPKLLSSMYGTTRRLTSGRRPSPSHRATRCHWGLSYFNDQNCCRPNVARHFDTPRCSPCNRPNPTCFTHTSSHDSPSICCPACTLDTWFPGILPDTPPRVLLHRDEFLPGFSASSDRLPLQHCTFCIVTGVFCVRSSLCFCSVRHRHLQFSFS